MWNILCWRAGSPGERIQSKQKKSSTSGQFVVTNIDPLYRCSEVWMAQECLAERGDAPFPGCSPYPGCVVVWAWSVSCIGLSQTSLLPNNNGKYLKAKDTELIFTLELWPSSAPNPFLGKNLKKTLWPLPWWHSAAAWAAKTVAEKCPSSSRSCTALSLFSTLRSTKWDLNVVQLPLISVSKNQASVLLLSKFTSLPVKPWAVQSGWLHAGTLLELGRLGHCVRSVPWVCAGGSEGCPRVCQPPGSLLLF